MDLQFMIAFDDSIGNDHFVHFGLITRDERKLFSRQSTSMENITHGEAKVFLYETEHLFQ